MAYNNRPISPGGRRIQNPGRASDSRVNDASIDQYQSERHGSYASPRATTSGVIPISSETFVNYPSSQTSSSTQQRYDSYSGRPVVEAYSGRARGPSYTDAPRASTSTTTQSSSRNAPKVVQADYTRPTSPPKGSQGKEFYTTPAVTKEPRKETTTRKLYAVNDGTASLVADVTPAGTSERHHKRRDSNGLDRSGYKSSSTDNDRGRRGYNLNGPSRLKEKSIDDEGAFSYTDPASMFAETEPRWRARDNRPRRNSLDRVGGGSRERPVSMLDPAMDPRRPNKDIGPPPSMRGWDKIKDVVSRSSSVRDRPRDVPQSPTRAKEQFPPFEARMPRSPTRGRHAEPGAYGNPKDTFYVAPRMPSIDRSRYTGTGGRERSSDRHDQFEFREPRPQERRNSMTRVPDHSVERRGFGIRSDSRDPYARASDESFTPQTNNRDSGYGMPEPQRHNTAPDLSYYDEQRLDQEKRDRLAERQRADERDRQRDREVRSDKEPRGGSVRDEDHRRFSRDDQHERDRRRERDAEYDLDRQRERERERMMQPQPQSQGDRQSSDPHKHHHRRSSYRDHDFDRKENGPRDSGDSISQPGLSTAAIGGLGAAAAAYGVENYANKKDDRDRDRDRERERDRNRDRDQDQGYGYDRPHETNRERASSRVQELRPPQDNRSQGSHSDESAHYPGDREHHRPGYNEPGLGFAFEDPFASSANRPARGDRPDAPHPATGTRDLSTEQQDFERTHDDRPLADTAGNQSSSAMDPDEDFRRRLEQVQRELGRGPEEWQPDPDPDRERRRRERMREREMRNGDYASTAGGATNSTYSDAPASSVGGHRMPGSYDEGDSVDGASVATSSTARPGGGLRRRRSILDEPMAMSAEPAQIIDNSMSEKRENRVRIVDPPTEEEERKPRGILKKPTEKFPEHPDAVREGVAPLKEASSKSGIPPGARWTKIDRRLVNPEALEDAKERFEERLDFVIVLRVLTKDEIQKLAYRTDEIRRARGDAEDEYYQHQPHPSQSSHHHHHHRSQGGNGSEYTSASSSSSNRRSRSNRERRDNDEYEDENSEDEFKPRAPKMLEAAPPSNSLSGSGGGSGANGTGAAVAAALLNAVAGVAGGGDGGKSSGGGRRRD